MQKIIDQSTAVAMESLTALHTELSEPLIRASQLAVDSLTNGGKLCFASDPECRPLAELIVDNLMHSKQDLRPALPAVVSLASIDLKGKDDAKHGISASLRKLVMLCQPGDCILLLLQHCDATALKTIDQFCFESELAVISICQSVAATGDSNILRQPQAESYVPIPLFVSSIARKQEGTLFILNCLSAMIEASLFGHVIEQ